MVARLFLFVVSLTMALVAQASSSHPNEQQMLQRISERLGIEIVAIAPSSVPGLYRLDTSGGVFYSDEKGDYALLGTLFDLRSGIVNLTLQQQQTFRLKQLSQTPTHSLYVRAPSARHELQLFTDLSCQECITFRRDLKALQNAGVSINLLPVPRPQLSADRLRHHWCHEMPEHLDLDLPEEGCDAILEQQTILASQLGVHRSPTWILPNGDMVSGYQSPKQLLKLLEHL